VVSTACQTSACTGADLPLYPANNLNYSGSYVQLNYGDSATGTYAKGPIVSDTAAIAGVAMDNQRFAAINSTTNPILQYGAVGIFGLGFPSGRCVTRIPKLLLRSRSNFYTVSSKLPASPTRFVLFLAVSSSSFRAYALVGNLVPQPRNEQRTRCQYTR